MSGDVLTVLTALALMAAVLLMGLPSSSPDLARGMATLWWQTWDSTGHLHESAAQVRRWRYGRGEGRSSQGGRAASAEPVIDAGLLLDLTGAMLLAGVGIEAALHRLADCVPGAEPLGKVYRALIAGASWERAWSTLSDEAEGSPVSMLRRLMGRNSAVSQEQRRHAELRRFGEHLSFSHATGAPTAHLLHSAAARARSQQRERAEERAAALGVQMVLPLGLFFLPAFIVLGVIPVVLGLLSGTLNS